MKLNISIRQLQKLLENLKSRINKVEDTTSELDDRGTRQLSQRI
jgi:ribosomal protein S6